MQSLDPRVNRLPLVTGAAQHPPLDQLATFEVFVQPKEGKPFQHEGAVHAPNPEMAFVLAKEAFTRRFTCVSLSVIDTHNVFVSPTTEGDQHVFDLFKDSGSSNTGGKTSFEIYLLSKRGKQHIHAGTVEASSPEEAMVNASLSLRDAKIVYNMWAIRTADIRFTTEEEKDLWTTLPEKRFRDAADYKGGDKLKTFLERSSS